MRILLTGASGFLGKYLIRQLSQDGMLFSVLARNDLAVRALLDVKGIDIHQFDLLADVNPRPLLETVEATHLIHLAWFTKPGQFWEADVNQDLYLASRNFIEAFCESGGKCVTVAGTCFEYGSSPRSCDEATASTNPDTKYAASKAQLHEAVERICDVYGTSLGWARIFFPYGQGEPATKIIPSLIRAFRGEIPPFVVSREDRRDFIHAADVAAGLAEIAKHCDNGTYNVSSGISTKIAELVEIIAHSEGADPNLILGLSHGGDRPISAMVGRSERLRTLGWSPKISLIEGIRGLCESPDLISSTG
tara:strand:+ start:565 stop:1482 length:918 start_codon:yes stop_codon:yes gene_type:complete